MSLPPFDQDGLLPAGDYDLTFDELRASILVKPSLTTAGGNWDEQWRLTLVNNAEILAKQLWQVGIQQIFLDGSFVEDKDHPNDIDGYSECDAVRLANGVLQRELNALDPYKVWTWDPKSRQPYAKSAKNSYPCGTAIESNSIPISASRRAYWTNLEKNCNFRPPSDFLAGSINKRESSEYQLELNNDQNRT